MSRVVVRGLWARGLIVVAVAAGAGALAAYFADEALKRSIVGWGWER